MHRGVGFFQLACGLLGAVACTYFSACATQVTSGDEADAAPEGGEPPSGPPTDYNSGPPANPYGDGGDVTVPQADGGTDGGSGEGGGPTSCNTPGDCPGNNAHDNVKCTSHTCSLSCQGEFYDVNGNPTDGCELQDSPIDKHTQAKAVDLGSFSCNDTSSAQNISGQIPSDSQVHENPAVEGFVTTVGAAPDWYKIHASGGGCVDDANFDLNIVNAKQKQGCYRLTLITDKQTAACSAGADGKCNIPNGASSYTDGSDVYLYVEKLCPATTSDDASYQITGHL